MRSATAQKFIAALIADGVIAPESANNFDQTSPRRIVAELKARGDIDEDILAGALAKALHMRHVTANELDVTAPVREMLARCHPETERMLPLYRDSGVLHVAIEDPFDVDLRDRAESLFAEPVELVLGASKAITDAIKRFTSGHDRLSQVSRSLPTTDESHVASSTVLEHIDENSAPVVKLVNSILREAVAHKASDVHIEAQPQGTSIRYRIDGVLRPMMEPLEHGYHDALITRIKVMAELDIAEHRLPQDGRFSAQLSEGRTDFRVSILPGADSEAVVIRVLDTHGTLADAGVLRLELLGLPDVVLREFRKAVLAPYGLVLVTGPTGSGKTTTLYAALNELDRAREKIITIEDPIEYRLPGILQIPVNEKKKVTFASGLRSILRHDPDKIMVGEIRDIETANIAVQSALTGHLVFTTVHANDSLDVVFRMKHMGIDPVSFVHALNCVLAQRLIRKLCVTCRRPVEDGGEMLQRFGLSDAYSNIPWHVADGCDTCAGTGYSGRTVIAELLRVTPNLREALIVRHSGQGECIDRGGMPTLRDAALQLAAHGATSLEEVIRVTGLD